VIDFTPLDSFTITGVGRVFTGKCPVASNEERGADLIGQVWTVNGEQRTVKALETHAVPLPLKVGDEIGVIFED
jgi:hypothetical protein